MIRKIFCLIVLCLISTGYSADTQDKPVFQLLNSSDLSSNLANYFEIENDSAYIVTQGGLEIFDITDPVIPKKIGQLDFGPAYRIDVEGDYGYAVRGGTDGIIIIDISQKGQCSVVAHYKTASRYVDIQVKGNHMFLTALKKGLEIVDISHPEKPVVVSQFFESGEYSQDWMGYSCLYIKNDIAYVGQSEHELKIIDISDINHPKKIAALPVSKFISEIYVTDDYLFLGAKNELSIFDVSDMKNPKKIACLNDFGAPCHFAIKDNMLVVYDDKFLAIDISDPASPKIIGTLNEFSHRLQIHGDYLYSIVNKLSVYMLNL